MRSSAVALLLVITFTASAGADEPRPAGRVAVGPLDAAGGGVHDGGLDAGGAVAMSGGLLLSVVYPATAAIADVGDALCALGRDSPSCNTHAHRDLEIPVFGGFIYAAHGRDEVALGALSSVVQLGAVGMLVGGLVAHHWRVPARRTATAQLAAFLTTAGVGLRGRF